jgi:curved DNA-binding protein CbpA
LGVVNGPGGLEIPPELQRELRDLASREGRISHYELLGIPADADGAVVRRAFLQKSKAFHPDAWYRKNLGEFAPLLTRAFQRVSIAYQVLSDPESRGAYDKENLHLFDSDERARIEKRVASEEDERRREREKRERLLRMKGFARLGAARQLFEQAQASASEGNRGEAILALKTARELDPQRKEIAQRLAELEREALRARVESAIAWAKDLEPNETEKAKGIYLNAFTQDPSAVEAVLGAARCCASLAEWQQAASLSQKVIELNPSELGAHLIAARAFTQLKLKARAKAELQFVLGRRPDHPEAKALLKGL